MKWITAHRSESLEKANQASTFNAKAETLTERPA
jgi:hypothetical protein